MEEGVKKKVEMIQLDPNKVILRFYCPNHCSCEIHDAALSDYMHTGAPNCCECKESTVYMETTLKGEA